jgi:phosphonate transport system ATP-binding protein
MEALERVGLGDKAYERVLRLSGGEQQRVAIARLLVQDPRVIIADEPVASLDPARARDLLSLLSAIAKESGKTLIASVHSVDLARENFSRVIGLRGGEPQFDLPVSRVTDHLLAELYQLQGPTSEGVGHG